MASKCPLCGEAEKDLNHLLILWVVGFLGLYFCTSLVFLCILPVYLDQPGSPFFVFIKSGSIYL